MKKRVLFLCTHNSARSQMAEGLLRSIASDQFEVFSAGTEPGRLHPLALKAMTELGIDVSQHYAKGIDTYRDAKFDYVITVCDRAKESCPYLPGHRDLISWSFDDPSAAQGSEEERLEAFRCIRDQIRERLEEFVASA